MRSNSVKIPAISGDLESTRFPIKLSIEPPVPPAEGLIVPGVPQKIPDDRVLSISHRFSVGYAETIGFRDSMEDNLVICGNFRNKPDEDYFAIFDGHVGKEASSYCAKNLHALLALKLNQEGVDVSTALVQAFKETHEGLKSFISEKGTVTESGSTALVVLCIENELYIANAGDSRAVFCQEKTAKLITEDHKPALEREVKRIYSISGGFILKNRVQGKLAVSRSIGDFKWNPYVSEEPDIFGPFNWSDTHYEFLILACDGLWDVLDEKKACEMVRKCKNPKDAAVRLRDCAYFEERSRDNISVIVIWFPGFVPDAESEETSDTSSGSGSGSSESGTDSGSGESESEDGKENESDEEDCTSNAKLRHSRKRESLRQHIPTSLTLSDSNSSPPISPRCRLEQMDRKKKETELEINNHIIPDTTPNKKDSAQTSPVSSPRKQT